jgi:hypothetical protein
MSSLHRADTFPYLLTLGDAYGIAKRVQFSDMAAAEQCANAYLGREWGETRTISVATFYKLGPDNGWVFDSEMEF